MSSKHLLAALLLAGTMLTPVAGTARDRSDNDFSAEAAAASEAEALGDNDQPYDEQADDEEADDEQADDEQADDEQADDEQDYGGQSAGGQANGWGNVDNVTDLDGLSAAALDQELTDELDDIFQQIPQDQFVSLEQAYEVVMFALSDQGDDPNESLIDFYELEAEMAEAGTSVSDEVWAALEESDEFTMRARPGVYNIASQDFHLVGRDGRTTGRAAFGSVKGRFTSSIRFRR